MPKPVHVLMPAVTTLLLAGVVSTLPATFSSMPAPASMASPTAAAAGVAVAPAPSYFGKYWHSPIPASPRLDPGSGKMVRYLSAQGAGIVANLYAYGIPIYTASSSTPRYRVTCTKDWGVCGLERQPVPVPKGAHPNSGSDGVMTVVDPGAGHSYEFWQARRVPGGWRSSWGAAVSLQGPGTGGATGSGLSRIAGVVRTADIARRQIPHALVFSTSNACARTFRVPAVKTDGHSQRSDCIPEGSRVQLSPSVRVDTLPGITSGERAVAKALQRYGAYVIDVGAARAAFSFEAPVHGNDPYPSAGFPWDYWHMPHIPWAQLRVLRSWDGS